MVRVIQVFDDISCLLEAALPVDSIDSREVGADGGLDNVYIFGSLLSL